MFDVGTFQSHSDYQQQRHWKSVFYQVVGTYLEILATPPIIASDPDDEARPRKLGPKLIEYKIDIELATKRALGNDITLLQHWESIVFGEKVEASLAEHIARKCGKTYAARKLSPFDYFKFIRKGTPGIKRVPVARTSSAVLAGAA
jgi:hypothetical protein